MATQAENVLTHRTPFGKNVPRDPILRRTALSNVGNIVKTPKFQVNKAVISYSIPVPVLSQAEADETNLEHDCLYFNNELIDNYYDIIPKSLQMTKEVIDSLIGFANSYKMEKYSVLPDLIPEPEELYKIEDFIQLEKEELDDIPLPLE